MQMISYDDLFFLVKQKINWTERSFVNGKQKYKRT